MTMDSFRLAALDGEDLAVLSAHLQGALLRVRDLVFLPREKRFVFVAHRVPAAWATSDAPERGEPCTKHRLTGVHFERVLAVASRGIDREAADMMLEIVAFHFTPTNAPAGELTILLTKDCDIRLQVECIEAACSDLEEKKQDNGGRAA